MQRDTSCPFCRIVAAEIPAAVVFKDSTLLSFLDIGPLAEGHLLITPLDHVSRLTDLNADVCGRIGQILPILGQALLEVTGAEGFNVLLNQGREAGQVVPHVHFHLIPRRANDGLGYRWNAGQYAEGRVKEVANAFRAALHGHASINHQ